MQMPFRGARHLLYHPGDDEKSKKNKEGAEDPYDLVRPCTRLVSGTHDDPLVPDLKAHHNVWLSDVQPTEDKEDGSDDDLFHINSTRLIKANNVFCPKTSVAKCPSRSGDYLMKKAMVAATRIAIPPAMSERFQSHFPPAVCLPTSNPTANPAST